MSSVIVAVLLGTIIVWATSELRQASERHVVVASYEIKRRFRSAAAETNLWFFKGGLGRYFTSATLPDVFANGRTGYSFRAFIVDPFNVTLCEYVSDHRHDIRGAGWVREEALTTIVDFTRRVHAEWPRVTSAYCFLIDDFVPLRIDTFDEGTFITHDDAGAPAFFYSGDSEFHDAHLQELTTGPNSYKTLDIGAFVQQLIAVGLHSQAVVDATYAEAVLTHTTQAAGAAPVHAADVQAIVSRVNDRRPPY